MRLLLSKPVQVRRRLQTMPEFNRKTEFDLGPLRALQSETPTRMAAVRRVWPEICAALSAGHSLKMVQRRLSDGGFGIPYRTLVSCVNRIRREQARLGSSGMRHRKAAPRTGLPEMPPAKDRTDSAKRDPMENLRKYGTDSRPRFRFTGEPPDPSKLF